MSRKEQNSKQNLLFTVLGWPKLFGKFVQNTEKNNSNVSLHIPLNSDQVVRLRPNENWICRRILNSASNRDFQRPKSNRISFGITKNAIWKALRTMAGKQNLPSSSDALRELGYYLVQYVWFGCWYVLEVLFNGRFFSFTDSTFNIFNATLHDNMAVKLGYDLSLKGLFRSKSTNVFFF